MDALELINLVRPEHNQTSCNDEMLSNGFGSAGVWGEERLLARGRCLRCMLLQAANNEFDQFSEKEIKKAFEDWL